MFETLNKSKIPSSGKNSPVGSRRWNAVRIIQDKPILLVSLSHLSGQTVSLSSYLLCSLDQVLDLRDIHKYTIEKIQLLEPNELTGDGWQLHDIVNIRTIWVPVAVLDVGLEHHYREEYHSVDGRCFTFSNLSHNDPVRESNFESVYSVADPNPEKPVEEENGDSSC